MATTFPTTLQDLDATRGTATQKLSSPSHVTHHTLEDDTLEALQAKVGIDNSAVTTSLDYILKNTTAGHDHDGTDSKKVLATNLDITGLSASNFLRVNSGGTAVEGATGPAGTIVGTTDTQTLSNKTLTLPQINDTSSDHQYVFAVNELTADRTVTLPLLTGNDTFVFQAFAQTLTNKTIDGDDNTLTDLPAANLKIASQATGDLLYASSSTVWARLGVGTIAQHLISTGTLPAWGGIYKLVTTTRDNTAATGTVAYTGVGFKPTFLFLIAVVDSTTKWCMGFDDGTTSKGIGGIGDATNTQDNGSNFYAIRNSAGNNQVAVVSTFDSDGFTLSYTKNGSPTGTSSIYIFAFR